MPDRSSLLALTPAADPGWVDLRGLLLSGRYELFSDGDPANGLVARSLDFPFGVAAGRPAVEVVQRAVENVAAAGTAWAGEISPDEWHLLTGEETVDAVAPALPDWRTRGVTIHRRERLPERPIGDVEGVEIRIAPHGWRAAALDLAHLPSELLAEYESPWMLERPLAVALIDDRVAALCSAAFETERYWDVAVDTLEPYRRRGLAAACFEALAVDRREARGLEPVWGALDDNRASMGLAERLGFRPVRRLTSFVRRG